MAHGLSCPTAYGNLPETGIEPVSSALAGRLLTTGPLGTSRCMHLVNCFLNTSHVSIRITKHVMGGCAAAAAAAKSLQSCPTLRPQRWQPTRLPHPWDSPGNNTGVGCHFLLQCIKVKSESEVAQSCLTPSDPMDCSLPGSSIHGIFQARVLEWGAIAFSNGGI